jgi:hypothetical protein
MIMGPIGGPDTSGNAWKLATGAPIPPAGFTVQFRFSECIAPALGQSYRVAFSDAGGVVRCYVVLTTVVGPATVQVTLGGGSMRWDGVWAPIGVAAPPRTVHLSVDGAVVPTLYIDGVAVPLLPFGPVAPPPAQPINSARAFILNTLGGTAKGSFDWIMVTSGELPPTTIFCCPDGSPAN